MIRSRKRFSRQLRDAAVLSELNRRGLATQAKHQAALIAEQADAQLVTESWPNLTGKQSIHSAVNANKLYGANTGPGGVYIDLPRNVAPTEKFYIATRVTLLASKASSNLFLGISSLAYNATGVAFDFVNDLAIGIGGAVNSNNFQSFRGSALGLSSHVNVTLPQIDGAPAVFPAGDYSLTIIGDGDWITISLRSLDDYSIGYSYGYHASKFAGKTFGKVLCSIQDTRGTGGHYMHGVVIALGTDQPPLTKSVSGTQIVGITEIDRFVARPAAQLISDAEATRHLWRIMFPKGYDPRKPAPMIVRIHGANGGYAIPNRTWVRASDRVTTKALTDAGYIVICTNDNFETGPGIASNRFANNESMAHFAELIEWSRKRMAVSGVGLFVSSMGGQVAARLLAKRTVPNIGAVYATVPGLDWRPTELMDPQFDQGLINAFTGGTGTRDQAFAVMNDLADPVTSMLRPGWQFRGVPWRIVSVADDETCPPAVHHVPFLKKIAPYAPEASQKIVNSGGHSTAAQYDPVDLIAFFAKYL